MSDETEITEVKVTVEKTGGRVSRTGEAKKIVYTERVDDAGTIHRSTEVCKGQFDCGHYAGESGAGAVCCFCRFTVCDSCAKDERFVCDVCHRIVCPEHSTSSLFHPGKRFCEACAFRGLLREALRKRERE